MNTSQDRPLLETFPVGFVVLLTVFWGCLWFALWAALRGTIAAIVVALGSIANVSYFLWFVPAMLVVWLVSLAWVYRDIRQDRNPPLAVFSTCLLLLVLLAPTAFFMTGYIAKLSDYELTRNATSVFLQGVLQGPMLDIASIILALAIGSYVNRIALRRKYPGLHPINARVLPAAWSMAVLVGWISGANRGIMWGFMVLSIIGNLVSVLSYRATIRRTLPTPQP